MLNKVLKKMQAEGKIDLKKGTQEDNKIYPTSNMQTRNGFHAKANSQKGAERQRSMGNRMQKPSPAK